MEKKRPEQIRLVWRRIDELIPYEHNAKLHPQEQLDRLVGSFDVFGRIVPAGIDAQGNLIYGHGRILAARQRGDTEFPCIEIEGLTETQRRAFVHADNLLSQSGTDEEILRAEMQALQAAGFDVSIAGYDPAGLVLGDDEETPEIREDEFDEEPPEEPRTKRGQIWQLGDHRLMCGDATSAEDVHLCVGGGLLADMVFTDPPYGVAIGDKNKLLDEAGGKSGRCKENIVGDTLTEDELYPLLKAAFVNVREASAEDAVYFVTSPQGGSLGLMMMMMMRDAGLPVRHVLMWRKNAPTFSVGRLDYDYQHEPIFYTWTERHHNFRRGQYRSTVWDFPKPRASRLHPTMKPVELVANAILDGTEKGMVVLDPFGGSGTTLIACEQLGRRCRMMEIDPHYCDVIIDRWEAFTGKKAVLLDG